MVDCSSVATVLHTFRDSSDGAAVRSRDLTLMLLDCTSAPFSSQQFTPGHITCSGLVLTTDRKRVLLVYHRRFDRWLLPGGHVEPQDNRIWEAARREVIEETSALLVADPAPPLAGVDVHGIRSDGREPYHLHHDLIFQFQASSEQYSLSQESLAIAWCGPEDFDHYTIPDNVSRAYRRVVP